MPRPASRPPVSRGESDLQIKLLAMTFMLAYIPLSIQVAWVIDTYGFQLRALGPITQMKDPAL